MSSTTDDVAVLPRPRPPVDGTLALTVAPAARPGPAPAVRGAAPVTAETLLALDDADREAVADLLHDTVAQHVVAARFAAGLRTDEGVALVLDPLDLAAATLRDICWWLRPRGAGGLVPALLELAGRRHPVRRDEPALVLAVDRGSCADDSVVTGARGAAAGAAVRLVQAVALASGPAQVDLVVRPAGRGAAPLLRVRGTEPCSADLGDAARGLVMRAVIRARALGVDVQAWATPSRPAGPIDDVTVSEALIGGLLVRLPHGAAPTTGEDTL